MKFHSLLICFGAVALSAALPLNDATPANMDDSVASGWQLSCNDSHTSTEWCEKNYGTYCDENGTAHTGNVLYCGVNVCRCVH